MWYALGPGGYMGLQAWLDGSSMTYRALFSCWDYSAKVQTGWVTGEPGFEGFCERFGGEGTGAHCIIPVQLEQGAQYTVRVEYAGRHKDSGNLWRGLFIDVGTNTTTVIGTLLHPDVGNSMGYGMQTVDVRRVARFPAPAAAS